MRGIDENGMVSKRDVKVGRLIEANVNLVHQNLNLSIENEELKETVEKLRKLIIDNLDKFDSTQIICLLEN